MSAKSRASEPSSPRLVIDWYSVEVITPAIRTGRASRSPSSLLAWSTPPTRLTV
jgi:hypothetical protein